MANSSFHALVDHQGKAIFDLVASLQGDRAKTSQGKKADGGRAPATATPRSRGVEVARTLLQGYNEKLSELKGHGALVGGVVPEYLLPMDLFCRVALGADTHGAWVGFFDECFHLLHNAAWACLLLQVIRLFCLNRVTSRRYESNITIWRGLAGTTDDDGNGPPSVLSKKGSKIATEDSLDSVPTRTQSVSGATGKGHVTSGSNILSPAEVLLLKWLTFHHKHVKPSEGLFLTNFSSDLADGRVLASAIVSHLPATAPILGNLKPSKINPSAPWEGEEQRMKSAKKVLGVLRDLQMAFVPPPEAIAKGDSQVLLLLALSLFEFIPQLVPKATIDFQSRLNGDVTRTVDLSNPTSRPVTYSVRVEGSQEFSVLERSIFIKPKSRVNVPIKHIARFYKPARATIFFTSHERAVPIVFELISQVVAHKASATLQCEATLYEMTTIEIPVLNPFNADCTFAITLKPKDDTPAPSTTKRAGGRRGSVADGGKASSSVTTHKILPTMCFWPARDKIKVGKGKENSLKVNFLPLRFGDQKCTVYLAAEHGELAFDVVGCVQLPKPQETLKATADHKRIVIKDVALPARNSMIERNRPSIQEMLGKERAQALFKEFAEMPPIPYKVQYINKANLSGPAEVMIGGSGRDSQLSVSQKNLKREAVQGANRLTLQLESKGPGKYEETVVLRSRLDVRVYAIEMVVAPPEQRAALEFACALRQSIHQSIPVVNASNAAWNIQAKLSGDGFMGGTNLTVQPGKTEQYRLSFTPTRSGVSEGELALLNMATHDKYTYTLKGVGEDPVAEDHVPVLCVARKRVECTLRVRNTLARQDDVEYMVETDLRCITGPPTLMMGYDEREVDYVFVVLSPVGGKFTGSITFTAPDGEYFWYTLEVQAENPVAERTIQVETKVRSAVAMDIQVSNPMPDDVEFNVFLDGKGLIGDPTIVVPANGSNRYEAIFAPLLPGKAGGAITFSNDDIGEFWYAVETTALDADPVDVDPIEVAVGSTGTLFCTLENPTNELVSFRAEVLNRLSGFIVEGDTVLHPYEKKRAKVLYTPSSVEKADETDVLFSHPKCGRFTFHCQGVGSRPTGYTGTLAVNAALGQSASYMVTFTNPFPNPLLLDCALEPTDSGPSDAFRLLLPNPRVQVTPQRSLEIPVLFTPDKLVHRSCVVVLKSVMSDSLQGLEWRYLVTGTAESPASVNLGRFRARCRELVVKDLPLVLQGSGAIDSVLGPNDTPASLDLQLVFPPEHAEALARSCSVTIEAVASKGAGSSQGAEAVLHLEFAPLRPIRTAVQALVTHPAGGLWRFVVDLAADAAEPDDTIEIVSAMNKSSSVSFHLTNQFDAPAHFSAIILPEVQTSFAVRPATGMLAPYGSEGTRFMLDFTVETDLSEQLKFSRETEMLEPSGASLSGQPSEYGKNYSAQLVIDTDEMQWIYDLKGSFPVYQPPEQEVVEGKVETHISRELEENLSFYKPQRNYAKINTQAVKKNSRHDAF